LATGVKLTGVGQAKKGLSKLLAKVEAGETVEARNGIPVARLVSFEPSSAGRRFLAALRR